MATRKADRPLQRNIESARPVTFATVPSYTTNRDTTFLLNIKSDQLAIRKLKMAAMKLSAQFRFWMIQPTISGSVPWSIYFRMSSFTACTGRLNPQ